MIRWNINKLLRATKFVSVYILIALIVDIIAGITYKNINGYAWYRYAFIGAIGEHAYRVKSYSYHHDLAPNISKKNNAVWGGDIHTVNTNSLGFKDYTARDIPLRSHKPRIVFIGDSFTEGVGQNYGDTFVGLIDEKIGTDYSVLNAGVSSYSPIIYWKKIYHLINEVNLKFDELIVYLDISDIQDESTEYQLNTDGSVGNIDWIPTLPELIKENTILLAYIRSFRERNKAQELIDSAGDNDSIYTYKDSINRHRSLWTIDDKVFQEYGRTGLKIAEIHMNKLLSLLKENNIKMKNFDEEKQTIVYPIESSDNTKSRIRLPWTCPKCKEICAESQSELIQKFGVRKMHGIVHNQSWCRRCRCS